MCQTIDQLKAEIDRKYNEIPKEMTRHVCDSIASRYQQSLDKNGYQFERLR